MEIIKKNSCQEIDVSIAFVFDYEGEGVGYAEKVFTCSGEDGDDFLKLASTQIM